METANITLNLALEYELFISNSFSYKSKSLLTLFLRMKMRRHRVFLICTVGLCVISFLHYYKALHYVSLLRELSAPYPNIKSFIMVTGFFWKEGTTPLSSASPEEGPPLVHRLDGKPPAGGGLELDSGQEPEAPQPWKRPEDPQRRSSETTEVPALLFCDVVCDFCTKQTLPRLSLVSQTDSPAPNSSDWLG